jgi:Mg-chelatase subunit ChlD
VIPGLLDRFGPQRLLIELPADLQQWIEWLGHAELEAPVALAGADVEGEGLSFYPFADFSPELAAIRWASARGVPIEAFDLPMAARGSRRVRPPREVGPASASLLTAFCRAGDAADVESLWDRLIEARAAIAAGEELRRAALLFGVALRLDAARGAGVDDEDLRREGHMRERLAARSRERIAAVVGAFHAAALLPEPVLWSAPNSPAKAGEPSAKSSRVRKSHAVVSSLVPYAFDLLDSRSGYPAGIRDPVWQQGVLDALQAGRTPDALVGQVAVEVCRDVRVQGHVAGVPDANEVTRLALDLARMRGLPGPGRREMIESIESALGQGELLGRGRVLARALERVLVGQRRGRLPADAPRSGLAPHLHELLSALGLPAVTTPTSSPVDVRLDPLRSDLDRRRHVTLERLSACGVPYGTRGAVTGLGQTDALGTAWRIRVMPATEAMVEMAAIRGVTLTQAAEGTLRATRARLEAEDRFTARTELDLLERAAECGLGELVREGLLELVGPFVGHAGLTELVAAAALLERVVRGHVPGLPSEASSAGGPGRVTAFEVPPGLSGVPLVAAAIRSLEGLAGSERLEDAQGLLELVRWFDRQQGASVSLGDGQIGATLDRLAREGSSLMQGAATAARVLLDRASGESAGETLGSWVDAATGATGRASLAGRLKGLLIVAGPRLEIDSGLLGGLIARVEALSDADFLERVAALREGFDTLSPAARQRLLDELAARHGLDPGGRRALDAVLQKDPVELAYLAEADRRGMAWLDRLGPVDLARTSEMSDKPAREALIAKVEALGEPARKLGPMDRWRLILGRERDRLAATLRPVARALDELYGAGRGEGSRSDLSGGGGREEPFPSVREWSGELEALFGSRVREEVLGRAAVRGRGSAVLALEPETVVPSVELLEQVLSLKGALPESQMGGLRRLVARIVAELVRQLAARVQPALAGLTVPKPTRRPGGRLDLRRTIHRNLRTVRMGPAGHPTVVPEQPLFRGRSRKSLDWRIILVVDVSGSMEASVIYSALMAAILGGLPAISVHFLAFSTEVIDLTHRVSDPLGLLLEVSVGGGTNIAQALRHARQLVTVPSRTLLVTVSDFEEGFSVEALVGEVRSICESGVKALGLAALDDAGKPRYDVAVAEQVAAAGMPIAALTPLELAAWVGEQIR